MFRQFLEAKGLKEVVNILNSEGMSSPTRVGWNKTVVQKVLTSC